MYVKWIEVTGLRGFTGPCRIQFGIPNGETGSGLTVIVGPNNAGKSTVIEALRALSKPSPPSFSEGQRNIKAGSRVEIRVCNSEDITKEIRTTEAGGSETEWVNPGAWPPPSQIFVLPSRRTFQPFFTKSLLTREQFVTAYGLPPVRGQAIDHFSGRIFQMQANRDAFDRVLGRVLRPLPDWRIELADNGTYYLKFDFGGQCHNSDGAGDGLVSLLFIVDALYDSQPGSIIAIDEPELSLHPSLQRKLADLIAEYAKDRQIVLATHSPYFVDWAWVVAGARIARLVRESSGLVSYQLTNKYLKQIEGLRRNLNNPHILGLDARGVFFLEDNVILVEGQEDVICYRQIAQQLQIDLLGEFYGWGVGGAHNMRIIAGVLNELGFKKVVGLLDNNHRAECDLLAEEFPGYSFMTIPADDVRSKPEIKARDPVHGLLDEDGTLREHYRAQMTEIFRSINSYLSADATR